MRRNTLKNAAVLTVSDIVLRLAGMGFRIWLANALGGEGMGLYQLVLAMYGLFITLATAGISVAATRLLAEELLHSPAAARGMLRRLLGAALGLGGLAAAGQLCLAGPAARWWLGDVRAAAALRVSAFSLPCMAAAAVLRGFFLARRRVEPNVLSQLAEQTFRIGAAVWLLRGIPISDLGGRCAAVLAGSAASELLSAALMLLFARAEAKRLFGKTKPLAPADTARRLWAILWPVEGGRVLASALRTAENMLVPACLGVYLAQEGGREAALLQYGSLKGMALPLLTFPFGLLGSLAVLLMPEITQAQLAGRKKRLHALLKQMLTLTMYFSAFTGALFGVWGRQAAQLLFGGQGSGQAGLYLCVLGPAMPLLYLESMVDGAMKGIGEQKAAFRYGVWDSALRIAGVMFLLPQWGMRGFLFVVIVSAVYTCTANTLRLMRVTGLRLKPGSWLGGPLLAAGVSCFEGVTVRRWLTLLPGLSGRAALLARLVLGGGGMALVYLAAAWPLGLGQELRRLRGR